MPLRVTFITKVIKFFFLFIIRHSFFYIGHNVRDYKLRFFLTSQAPILNILEQTLTCGQPK
jgi:hypothetical protein